jgi:hypothetical protein
MTTLSSYLSISGSLAKWQSIEAKSAPVATATAYYKAHIGAVKSAADLVKDPRLFNYAMTAFGLGDRTYAKGLMTKVLQQGVATSATLARKLNDPNILAFAKAFDFAGRGATVASTSAAVQNVVAQYAESALETDQGKQSPGVQLALYFQRKAPGITDAYGIMADKQLLSVVQTALNISPMTGLEPIDQQAKLLSSKIKFADFQDPKKLQNFIARFTAMYDYNNAGADAAGGTSTNAILLGAAQGTAGGVGQSLLQSMQSYRTS